ncbi:COBRA-like protein 10 [Macadamia integrifolia]|uniref:COBRA-like protein 10 n=1 Tax=Macadamia integrifolia TaxID=60698 RepID=UPI001C4F456A|nr:COBRA-like protein 10 [Macadamia integrifolia]
MSWTPLFLLFILFTCQVLLGISIATALNVGVMEVKAWKIHICLQHTQILVSASNAVLVDGDDFLALVGNGTHLVGYPHTDLKTSIDTAYDTTQIQEHIVMAGKKFGVKQPVIPLPKAIRLGNDGYKCPAPIKKGSSMHVCRVRDPKFKTKKPKPTKFLPLQEGDLSITYDITQASDGNYLTQITMENNHPSGHLDHWNSTWEWMRGEFIYSMKGAYTCKKDPSDCIYGSAGECYQDFDFSSVMNYEKKTVISDLPVDRAKDEKVGNILYCCRNGTFLPTTMDKSKSKAAFQMQVYKRPPDLNRTAVYPPQRWKISGVLNPDYKCGSPIRVDPTEIPDTSGLDSTTSVIATWQVVCNITRPKSKSSHCCASFSAFYSDSVIPCNTCTSGSPNYCTCNPNSKALLLPPEALLFPFDNRTEQARAWAKLKHYSVPNPLPCSDNCGVSINWYISSYYRKGWTARITLLNWEEISIEDWFTAIQMNQPVFRGYENVYSFSGAKVSELSDTFFFQGLPGLKYLMGETNVTNPIYGPRVPGKQQSVISFSKKRTPGINIVRGDGHGYNVSLLPVIVITVMTTYVLLTEHL